VQLKVSHISVTITAKVFIALATTERLPQFDSDMNLMKAYVVHHHNDNPVSLSSSRVWHFPDQPERRQRSFALQN